MLIKYSKNALKYLARADKQMQIAEMIDMLPEKEQDLACEMVKRIVLAWDPDFTKVTDAEAKELEEAEKSGYVDEKDIDWDNLEKYA